MSKASDSGSGRAGGDQFADRVIDGIRSNDDRPEGRVRKHWPKPLDSVEIWLEAKRNEQTNDSPGWWAIQQLLVEYRQTAGMKTWLGATIWHE